MLDRMIHFFCWPQNVFPSQKCKAFCISICRNLVFRILRINGMVWLPNKDIITAELNMRGRQIQRKVSFEVFIPFIHCCYTVFYVSLHCLLKAQDVYATQTKVMWQSSLNKLSLIIWWKGLESSDLLRGHTLRKSAEKIKESRGKRWLNRKENPRNTSLLIQHIKPWRCHKVFAPRQENSWFKLIKFIFTGHSQCLPWHSETAETMWKSQRPLMLLITSVGWKTVFTNWLTALAKHVTILHTVAISQTECQQSICRSRLGKSPKEIKSPLPHRERCADH